MGTEKKEEEKKKKDPRGIIYGEWQHHVNVQGHNHETSHQCMGTNRKGRSMGRPYMVNGNTM
jgi:hypothetical protein